jgi:cell division protein ZapA
MAALVYYVLVYIFSNLAALQLAISSVSLARSREVGSEDLRRLEALRDEIDEYLNRIETEKK